ncbi:bifunctional DNA primase/polymerase, partial [bacterium]|nr:bifunctional DNA primase/polymerase [bacterium]
MSEKNYSKIWEQFATFPCQKNGKKPATKRGFKDALFGQDVMSFIKQGYNVALACEMSNVVVLDLDYHDSNSTAIEDIRDLEKVLGVLPLTLRQSTASGKGQHLIFSAKGITKPIGKIGKFCDVKYSGYIMIAPSTINGRQYEITEGVFSNGDILIAELPERWLDYLNKDIPANNTVVDYS